MSSNILAGERRWASARRTGMTVLGKVAVPKPLNLPSQKLENHGMDPNVEIVPKGSISWGSRPSSSASNPWGSSSVSSTAEGRPSSSGSRPSTAGSEIAHDHGGNNAWGLNSRPSSASGVSASNQTSLASLRPHSADTRPASSQISRFAEQHTDSVAVHHPVVASEKAGLASSSEKERFSLSSGDFPTLNSVADSSLKSSDPRDQGSHSHPSSASGGVPKDISDMSQADIENGTVNAWKRDGHKNSDVMYPSMDTWHGEPPYYHNANVPPPHFDGWRGPSMNHPGVWYQGPPLGQPYGPPPVGPGGFPVEPPFSFYCPRVLSPMGHSKNGELYRPQMPDAFVRPGMQFRPGFYHGPPMPFEGYYGPPPPMGYCNPNELEVPFNGIPPGPHGYNRYPARDNDSGNKRFSEKPEPNHLSDAPEHIILKHSDDVNQEGQWGVKVAKPNSPNPKKRSSQPGMASWTKEWGAEYNNEDDMFSRSAPHDVNSSSGLSDVHGGSDSFTIRSGPTASPLAGDASLSSSAIVRGPAPTLIQKIGCLNEKTRTCDSRNEGSHYSQWSEQEGTGAIIGEIMVPLGDDTSHVMSAAPRRGYGVLRGKKFNGPDDGDGWQKKSGASIQSPDISFVSNFHVNQTHTTAVAAAADVIPEKREVDSEVVDATDSQTQHLKTRELVKQRALQLQKEEDRTREQKSKALAKLEELNRRNITIHKEEKAGPEATGGEWGEDEPADSDDHLPLETPKTSLLDTPFDLPPNQSLPIKEESPVVAPKKTHYKPKQNVSRKTFVTKARNNNTELADSETGTVTGDVGSGTVESSSSQQRRRSSNRNIKNKPHNKSPDDLPHAPTFPSTASDESKPPQAVTIQAVDTNGDRAQGSVVNHHHQKPQKSSRFARNQPSNKFSDKYNGNDNAVWAPVQLLHNKTEPLTETGRKTIDESAVISAKNDDQMQNNMKNKRAEMERYVPKPVAKELAQQITVQQTDEVTEKVDPDFKSSGNVTSFTATVTESPVVEDLKHNNKQTKVLGGGWRQRVPSSCKPNGPSSSFKPKSSNQQQSMEHELSITKTEEQQSCFKDDDDGKIRKRHVPSERSTRNEREHGNQKPDLQTHIQLQDPKMNPIMKSSSSKENRGSEDRPLSSHWQPKSSSILNTSGGDTSKMGIIQSLPEEHIRGLNSSSRVDPSVHKGSFSIEGTVNNQQGQRREKKVVQYASKGQHSHAPTEDEYLISKQQHFSSDYRRGGGGGGGRYHQNVRSASATNHEFREDLNQERHGQNIHYEYQPIHGKNEKKFENTEEDDGLRGVGPTRYKEKGQQSRHGKGQFHGRQNSNVQVGAGYG